jgi:hypothetical protein
MYKVYYEKETVALACEIKLERHVDIEMVCRVEFAKFDKIV